MRRILKISSKSTCCVQFQSTCNLCQESHKTQVWLCFLVLSSLSISTCAASADNTRPLQFCLKALQNRIEKSDAMLYAPSVNDIKENCENVSLKCYMLELIMVLNEEEVNDTIANCIFNFNDILRPNTVGCPPCEAYSLKNITIFLDRLNNLLEKMTAQKNK
ncbi:interleukin-15 isoform X3 [Toxotes jaculatrix]|uniref:interleukin-15 isoform X3 n=1 Tax=Toxotes jaculatrix TaxID=941984 RepID=UPI001B3AF1FC|nr:interleukin-15 isoform X3 [Toxotes jaculatrix]